jgi:hypothetical protein
LSFVVALIYGMLGESSSLIVPPEKKLRVSESLILIVKLEVEIKNHKEPLYTLYGKLKKILLVFTRVLTT